MLCYNDETYCASPNCENKCGRQMSYAYKEHLHKLEQKGQALPVSYAYFCGEPNPYEQAGKKIAEKYAKALKGLADK
jgi:hypothetical protein